jgi:hypothetical protein
MSNPYLLSRFLLLLAVARCAQVIIGLSYQGTNLNAFPQIEFLGTIVIFTYIYIISKNWMARISVFLLLLSFITEFLMFASGFTYLTYLGIVVPLPFSFAYAIKYKSVSDSRSGKGPSKHNVKFFWMILAIITNIVIFLAVALWYGYLHTYGR